MSLQLRIDEIQHALALINHPAAAAFERAMCGLADAMAAELAIHFDMVAGEAEQAGTGFAFCCVPFQPSKAGQPFPDVLEQFDDGGREDWEEHAADASAFE